MSVLQGQNLDSAGFQSLDQFLRSAQRAARLVSEARRSVMGWVGVWMCLGWSDTTEEDIGVESLGGWRFFLR